MFVSSITRGMQIIAAGTDLHACTGISLCRIQELILSERKQYHG